MAIIDPELSTGPHAAPVDPAEAAAYAAATNDPNPRYADGAALPPLYAVVPTWAPVWELGQAAIPPEWLVMLVHSAQDIHYLQPLVPGATLSTVASVLGARGNRFGTSFTIRAAATDEAGATALELYTSCFVRGLTGILDEGDEPPGHEMPREVRSQRLLEQKLTVDPDQPVRYAAVSGDVNPIHLDADVARAAGLPGVINHGLCTMAMCSGTVVAAGRDGDPADLRRIAVRFTRPVIPGSELVVSAYDGGRESDRDVVYFEAKSRGRVVVKDGRAEFAAR
ncbi:MAG: MaoC family dehydratase N-terminal domain-containing protein [Acidimicrobiia bacterium]|nr:MaoC family dehydratase N-terminal domain-containing protein [Acidimicrobiia bacterium]